MKFNFFIVFYFWCFFYSPAQELSVSLPEGNQTNHADFYAFDSLGNRLLDITKDDSQITVNNKQRKVIRVTHPQPTKPKSVSLVLCLDISGSMMGKNIDVVTKASHALLNIIPFETSEVAVVSFDHDGYINSDFSHNKERLNKAINELAAAGGTNYDKAFHDPFSGALNIASKGQHQKVIIFLTDGLGHTIPEKVVKKAIISNIIIYCITLGIQTPPSLKTIASKSGGRSIEILNRPSSIQEQLSFIYYQSAKLPPSTITWRNELSCEQQQEFLMRVPNRNLLSNRSHLKLEAISSNSIHILHPTIVLSNSASHLYIDTALYVKSNYGRCHITDVFSPHPDFQIDQNIFPLTLDTNNYSRIPIKYKPTSSKNEGTRMILSTDLCVQVNAFISNRTVSSNKQVPLKITFPNGGESFYATSDTTITWTGVAPGDVVKLEYSFDNGQSWHLITERATNLQYHWQVPRQLSTQALVKATLVDANLPLEANDIKKLYSRKMKKEIFVPFDISGDSRIYFENSSINQYALEDNQLIHTIPVDPSIHNYPKEYFKRKKSTLYASLVYYNPITKQYVLHNHSKEKRFQNYYDGKTKKLVKIEPSLFGSTRILSTTFLLDDSCQYSITPISNHTTKSPIYKINVHTGEKEDSLLFSLIDHSYNNGFILQNYLKDGMFIIGNRNGLRLDVVSFDLDKPYFSYTSSYKYSYRIQNAYTTSHNQYLIVTISSSERKYRNKTLVINMATGEELYQFEGHKNYIDRTYVAGDLLLCPYYEGTALVQVSTGRIIKKFKTNNWAMSPNGKYLIKKEPLNLSTTSFLNPVEEKPKMETIFKIGDIQHYPRKGDDVSDQVFSIVKPSITLNDVDLGQVYLGSKKDSVIKFVVENPHHFQYPIDQVTISGKDKNSFQIIAPGTSFVLQPFEKKNIEFRFTPSHLGQHEAFLKVSTPVNSLQSTLSGEGIPTMVDLKTPTIYLGKVLVGTYKDTVVKNVLTNVGKTPLVFSIPKIIGTDIDQFRLQKPSDFKLKPNQSSSLSITFTPIKRGLTSTVVNFHHQKSSLPIPVRIIAEGVAPRQYDFSGLIIDGITQTSLSAKMTIRDQESKREVKSISTTQNGQYQYSLYPDRVYQLNIAKEGYTTEYQTIDLRTYSHRYQVQDTFSLYPILGSLTSDSLTTLYGYIKDKPTGNKLNPNITLLYTHSKQVAIPNVQTFNGGYQMLLRPDSSYQLIVDIDGYFPMTQVIDSTLLQENKVEQHFNMTKVEEGKNIKLENVLFYRSSPELLPGSFKELDMLVMFLQNNPVKRIDISGHTDNQGNAKLNLELSENRVMTIREYLIKNGISKKIIKGKGYGETQPVASNIKEETRRLNRRVEFKITY